MIQRKQTLFLLLIAAIAASCLFLNPAIGTGKQGDYTLDITYLTTQLNSDELGETVSNGYMKVSLLAALGLSIFSVFLFKNRKLQAMLTGFNFIFIGVIWFFIYYYLTPTIEIGAVKDISIDIKAGAFFTAVLPILNWLALRGIIADERLVKSMDRLR